MTSTGDWLFPNWRSELDGSRSGCEAGGSRFQAEGAGQRGDMTDAMQREQEAVGENYDAAMLLEARKRTWKAIRDIATRIAPGMAEEAAMDLARTILAEQGLLRGWHGIQLRFGENTLKNFGEPSEPGTVLRENDIFFIDIGPVWEKWEGDGGDTFVVGDDPVMRALARDVKVLFGRVHAQWRDQGLNGTALYAFAAAEAEAMGWVLNLDMAGHRLADFPHKAIHKGPLAEAPYAPSSGLWVLEIQIRHPTLPISAFYEDLLLDDDA
jgi:Metallopeptidase family M24